MPKTALTATRSATRDSGWLSRYARGKKLEYFFAQIAKDAAVLDLGCADGWVGKWAQERGWANVVGIDVVPPADIVGDVHDWRRLGIAPHSFDAVVAFEVVEHGDLAAPVREILKPDGQLMATTPVPRFDWVCKCLEAVGVLQRRSGPHTNLVDLRAYPGFAPRRWRTKGLISQWGILVPEP